MDFKGRLREWTVWVEHYSHVSKIFIRFGLANGQKHFESHNFDTPQKALEDMMSRYTHQVRRKLYSVTIPEYRPVAAMLCTEFHEIQHQLPNTVLVQPKLDGFRALGTTEYLISRQNTKFNYIAHITKALETLPPEIVLDGELYIHGQHFQEISSIVRTETFNAEHLKLKYHVYDIVDESLPFSTRHAVLVDVFNQLKAAWDKTYTFGNTTLPFPLELVDTAEVSLDEVPACYKTMREEKFEGLIIRDPTRLYECGIRSYGLSRIKHFDVTIFKIIDVIPNKLRPREAKLVLQTNKEKKPFECSIKADTVIRAQILKHREQFLETWCKVEHQGFSMDQKPRCPVCIELLHKLGRT